MANYQHELLTLEQSDQIKARLNMVLDYDYNRMPYRVSYSILENFKRLAWFDGCAMYYGGKDGVRETILQGEYESIENALPEPIYRGGVLFLPITSKISVDGRIFEPVTLDMGYIEFFIDLISGHIGIDRTEDGVEIWRRFGQFTDHIEIPESFYGVRKPIDGVVEICLDMLDQFPDLAGMKVQRAVSIGKTLYNGLYTEPLRDTMIPKVMLPEVELNIKKAHKFFNLICPKHESQHNLKLATVYPYFKRSSEKFFVLKGCGGNGKSRFIRHFETLLGNKFTVVELAGMVGSGFDRSNAIGRLQGKHVLQAPETNLNNPKFVSELKRIATADTFVARTIGNNTYSFRPKGSLFIDTNFAVDMGNEDAIQRRLVGVQFIDRRLNPEEMAPYYSWVTTIEGACSIFAYAYAYYSEECGANFTWYDVDVGDGSKGPEEYADGILKIVQMLEEEEGYVTPSQLTSNAEARRKLYEDFGLETKVKKISGKSTRIIKVKDTDQFLEKCERYGYLS